MNKSLIVICGPTAVGKSNLAIDLAQTLNTAIISADSRQIYREFDIGTAKPDHCQLQQVPHFLLDICEPTEILTLAQYQELANQIIENSASFPLLLVGGTGLYIKSIVKKLLIPRVSPQYQLREQLQSLGQEQLYNFLRQIDPQAAQKISPADQTRTIRALEVYYVTGSPISQQQGQSNPEYPILQIGLDSDRDRLREKIHRRAQSMISAGLVEEVKQISQKYGSDLPLLNTLGYGEIKRYLAGENSLEDAQNDIILHTNQFAKRQRTWFRADSSITWFDADSPNLLKEVSLFVADWLNLL
jgi:tRNA dimethylallyltransferase